MIVASSPRAARCVAVAIAVAACGGSAPPPVLAHRALAPRTEPHGLFRRLAVGLARNVAHRTTFELVLDGDRAELVETEQRATGAFTIERADREAPWTTTSARRYRGHRRALASGALALDLATADMQPLHLTCTPRRVAVAAAGARRVPSPDRPADYDCGDPGVWDPPTLVELAVLACGAAGQPADDGDDDGDDLLLFAPSPGVELASENDDCIIQGAGLRVAR